MSTHLLTPRMASLLALIARAARAPMHTMTPAQARVSYAAAAEVLDFPRTPLVRVEDFTIAVTDGTLLQARLYANSHDRVNACLYLHGGGFVIGGLETHDSLCRQLALHSGGAIVALDYRLAPEFRFPTAATDSADALRWLADNGHTMGLNCERPAVAGDSAGGTLAAACALAARGWQLPLALQLLITPGTTAYADTPSHQQFGQGYLLDAATVAWFFDHYIDAQQRTDWRFAPLHVDDLEGLAPACVVLAECDPLIDEGLAYADRLRAAHVPVTLELARGVTHDFIKMGRMLPEARHAIDFAAHALREAWQV